MPSFLLRTIFGVFLVGLLANFKVEAQFFNGATSASCVSLSEPGFTAQTGPSPYFVTFSPGIYRSGEAIEVTLQSSNAQVSSFNAIMCQARPLSGGSSPEGSFEVQNSPDYQYVVCSDASAQQISVNGTITNVNSSPKFLPVTFSWVAPGSSVGDVIFFTTVVQSNGIFWEAFQSQALSASLCPPDTTAIASPGVLFYYVTDIPLSLPGNIAVTSGPEPTFIMVGMTGTVTYTFSNDQSCSFDVTVVAENTPPTIICPPPVTVISLPGNIGNVATYNPPECFDAEDNQNQLQTSCSQPSGAFFQGVGPMTVTCTCTDSCQDTDSCTFIVNVDAPNTPPTITCPGDLTVKVNVGATGDLVTFNPPVCIDPDQNNQNLAVLCNPMGNSFLPLGSNTVTCSCTDLSGATDICSFTVTVFENTPPTITCPPPVTVISLPGNIGNIATYNPPQCIDAVDNQNQLQTSCSQPSGAFFQGVGPMTVTCTCTDSYQDTDSCTFVVNIDVPNTTPTITCPGDLTVKVNIGAAGDLVTFNPPVCIDPDQNNQNLAVSCNPMGNSFLQLGSNTVTCSCTDLSGATDTCSFTVTVVENTPPTIICPPPVTMISLPGNIGNIATYNPPQCIDAEDNQNQLQTSCSQPSGAFFQGVGPMTVTCTCTDSCQDTDSCTFIVNIDAANTPPVIKCPAPVTVDSLAINVGNTASWADPTCTDSEQNDITLTINCNPTSGSFFSAVQSNNVICTCTDDGGLSDTCVFTVTVQTANTPPVITCPAPVTVDSLANNVGNIASWADPTCNDLDQNDITLTINCNSTSGSFFSGVQSNDVICTCTDNGGLSDTCVFTVTVENVCNPTPCQKGTEVCSVDNGVAQCIDVCNPTPCQEATDVCSLNNGVAQCTDSSNGFQVWIILVPSAVIVVTVLSILSIILVMKMKKPREERNRETMDMTNVTTLSSSLPQMDSQGYIGLVRNSRNTSDSMSCNNSATNNLTRDGSSMIHYSSHLYSTDDRYQTVVPST